VTDPAPAPLGPDDARLAPTWRAAYSDRTALLMAELAELAYQDQGQLPALLQAGGFQLVGAFNAASVAGFVAVAPGQLAVLAWRGTADLADWGYDLDARPIEMPGPLGIEVHEGFWRAFSAAQTAARALVDRIPADLGLYITGHSLGGALAQIGAAAFERDTLAACYTFGSPRVATARFDELVKCPHYRVVDQWDLVPAVPPALHGFRHTGDPRLLKGDAPIQALRRDRELIPRVLVDLWSLLAWPFRKRLTAVDDHMIWNYRRRLQSIATARAPSVVRAVRSVY
jgi:hypothetical protein